MTKDLIAETISRKLIAYNRDRYDMLSIQDIYQAMDRFTAQLAVEAMYANLKLNDTYQLEPEWYSSYIIDVFYNAERELAYCTMPMNFVNLPQGRGLNYVGSTNGTNQYAPVSPNYRTLYNRGGKVLGRTGYFVEQKTIFFTNNIIQDGDVMRVLVRCIAPDCLFLTNTQDYPIPLDYLQPMMDRVFQTFLQTKEIEALESTKQ